MRKRVPSASYYTTFSASNLRKLISRQELTSWWGVRRSESCSSALLAKYGWELMCSQPDSSVFLSFGTRRRFPKILSKRRKVPPKRRIIVQQHASSKIQTKVDVFTAGFVSILVFWDTMSFTQNSFETSESSSYKLLGKWPTWCTNSFLCIYFYLFVHHVGHLPRIITWCTVNKM